MDSKKREFERAPLLAGTRVRRGRKLWPLVLAVFLLLVVGCLGMHQLLCIWLYNLVRRLSPRATRTKYTACDRIFEVAAEVWGMRFA